MNDWRKEAEKRKAKIRAFMNEEAIEITAEFVPFSQSRNKDESNKSLNWKVKIAKGNRHILTTDYSAGIAHCPSYNVKAPHNWDRSVQDWQHLVTDFECEKGAKAAYNFGMFSPRRDYAIKPNDIDVLYALVSDSDVLNYSKFEEWAENFGYDPDFRSAEKTYRACLEIALALRNGLGEKTIARLNELFQDY